MLTATSRPLAAIVLAGILVRVAAIFVVFDLRNDFYWEYGELARNLHAGKGYSFFYFKGDSLKYTYAPETQPFASAYMPPGYAVFLYPYFWVEDAPARNVLILGSHILAGALVIVLAYHLTRRLFGRRAALVAAGIAALLPEFTYAIFSFTPTVLFHAGMLGVLLLLTRREMRLPAWVGLGVLMAVLIYLRSEFALYVAIVVVVLLKDRKLKPALAVAATVAVLVMPWAIRNTVTFGQPVFIANNLGLGLYRGHSADAIGDWGDDSTLARLRRYRDDPRFEIRMNNMYIDDALAVVRSDPWREVVRAGAKLFHLWIFNPSDDRAWHPLYLAPWLVLLAAAGFGVWRGGSWAEHRFFFLYMLAVMVITVVFLALPRYQTMMKIALIPFAGHGVIVLVDRWRARRHSAGKRSTGVPSSSEGRNVESRPS